MSRTWLTAFRGAAIAAVAFGSLMHPTAAVAEAGPDNVTGAWGCEWPYACLYNSAGTKVSQYKAVTSGWQSFSRTDVYYGVNTRNDDVVYIRFTNGRVACLPAGTPGRSTTCAASVSPTGSASTARRSASPDRDSGMHPIR
ncbi:hypothetical protein ACFQV2_13755 [Actinokineospora soli]|uniref:Peptidase inhibitor family I36 n=1 Tax=Actinokineospora soli TaxID=1048753 RepID=A0ABW2TNQ8_9PSEU